jgi:iron-sulfur cluster repair protein YtfE (RIC family)
MSKVGEYMSQEHRQCDEAFARAEDAVSAGDWSAAQAAFEAFHGAMERHFALEEDKLFPAFEEATGMSGGGPTQTMRAEHEQMRGLFEELKQAAAARDSAKYLGLSETLLVLMQQHNIKEESMMYPMLEEALGARAGELIPAC